MSALSPLELRSLDGVSWDALAAAFTAGFSGYAVPMSLTAPALAAMQRRRGSDAAASVGAFAGDELVGFALTCRDGAQLYNSGTGVIPARRGAGLARQLVERVIAAHVGAAGAAGSPGSPGAASYVLEVLDSNAPAIQLYRRLGFVETRGLQCWSLSAPPESPAPPAPPPASPALRRCPPEALAVYAEAAAAELELAPSWQNTLASIARADEPPLVLSASSSSPSSPSSPSPSALLVAFPSSGDVPFLHVRAAARRRGLGRQLLAAAAAQLGKPLRLINLDERVASVAHFLSAVGAARTVRQLEMRRPLP